MNKFYLKTRRQISRKHKEWEKIQQEMTANDPAPEFPKLAKTKVPKIEVPKPPKNKKPLFNYWVHRQNKIEKAKVYQDCLPEVY